MRNSSNKSIAYHEAGHIIVYWVLTGRAPTRATIEPSIGHLGHVERNSLIDKTHLDSDVSDKTRVRAEKCIMIKLAGPLAQKRYSASSVRNYHASHDWLEAADFALRLYGGERTAMSHIGWLEYRTADLIKHQWRDVKRVAGALLKQKTLSKAQLQKTLMPAGCQLPVYFIPEAVKRRPPISVKENPIKIGAKIAPHVVSGKPRRCYRLRRSRDHLANVGK